MEERAREIMADDLREDVDATGGQKRIYQKRGLNPATVCRWIKQRTMPLNVYTEEILPRGGHRLLRHLAYAAGYELVPAGQRAGAMSRLVRAAREFLRAAAPEAV